MHASLVAEPRRRATTMMLGQKRVKRSSSFNARSVSSGRWKRRTPGACCQQNKPLFFGGTDAAYLASAASS
eukprot:7710856-Lingulodinium_polyedra.AAC.1